MPAFLFDFNGVLVDDEPVHFAAFRDVLETRGVALDQATYVARYLAFDDATAFRAILRDAGRAYDDAEIAACVREKSPRYFARVADDLAFFPGAFELLARCAKEGSVAIVSGAARAEIDFALARANAVGHVKTIVAAEDVGACKPDPSGYLEALRRLSVAASDAIVIEDSVAGVQAGLAAGCKVVGVAHSYPIDALVAAGSQFVVATIAELDPSSLRKALG